MIVCKSARVLSPALQEWRMQLGSRLRYGALQVPRKLAAVTFLAQGVAPDGLIDLRQLTICVLHDLATSSDRPMIRFAGYRARVVPWGIALGGPTLIRFEKDLALAPASRPFGRRFGMDRSELLPLALQLERRLRRHARFSLRPHHNQPRLPEFWVALAADNPLGKGPEFERFCNRTGWPRDRPLIEWQRDHLGQPLFPLNFVSHLWTNFRSVYIDSLTLRRSQVFRLNTPEALIGFQGAVQYDLLHSRFQTVAA